MNYAEVLLFIRSNPVVVVTGAQRSGTTIAARCLAADLGRPFLPEEAFGTTDLTAFCTLLAGLKAGVVQAPAMSSVCHRLPRHVAVVWMLHPLADIVASQERIGWEWEAWSLEQYFLPPTAGPVAARKLHEWRHSQRAAIATPAELEYGDLRGHRLWVEPELRKDFGPRQTAAGTP